MPRISRVKARQHASAVPVQAKRKLLQSQVQVVGDPEVEDRDEGAGPSAPLGDSKPFGEHGHDILPTQPYSKSHARRLKRKANQTLIGGELHSIAAALSHSLNEPEPEQSLASRTPGERKAEREEAKRRAQEDRKIGEGKGRTLGEKARRKQIAKEAKRVPLIMQHPAFKADPWATIRLHAINSLKQRRSDSSPAT